MWKRKVEKHGSIIPSLFLFYLCFIERGCCTSSVKFDQAQANAVRRAGVDSALLQYSSLAMAHMQPTAGQPFDVSLPPSLSEIKAQGMLIGTSTLSKRGLSFNEFSLPAGAMISSSSSASAVLLIYRSTLSFTIFTLPDQLSFVGPVLGIIAYPLSNSSSVNPSSAEIFITFPSSPVRVHMPLSTSPASSILCAFFFVNGSVSFLNVSSSSSGNTCISSSLGDLALVTSNPTPNLSPPSSTPPISPSISPFTSHSYTPLGSLSGYSVNRKLIVGAIFLTFAGLAFCVAVVLIAVLIVRKAKIVFMTHLAKNEENLDTSLIGTRRAPSAAGCIRTRPVLEMDAEHFQE